MNTKLIAPLFAVAALAAAPAFGNHATSKIVVDQAPPMVAGDDNPAEKQAKREGYVWAPGYWGYSNNKFEWSKGHYVATRKGYRYESPRWVQENGRWTLYPENWVKDEDNKDKTVQR